MLVDLALGLCAVIAVLLVFRYDLHDREPWYTVLGAAGLGALMMWGLSSLENFTIETLDIPIRPAALALVEATHEELTRLVLVAAIATLFRGCFNDPLDGLIYGSAIGLGMAVSESLSDLDRRDFSGSPFPSTEVVRVAVHMTFGGIAGFPIGMLRFRMSGSVLALLGCTIAAVGMHFAVGWISLSAEKGLHGRHQLLASGLVLGGLYLYGCLASLGTQCSRQVFEPTWTRGALSQTLKWPTTLFYKREATERAVLASLGALACASATATVTAFASDVHWTLELTSHFRVQYLFALFVAAVAFASARRFRWALLWAGLAVVNALTLAPLYVDPVETNDGLRLRALHINISYRNKSYESVLALVNEIKPHVLFIAEITPAWTRALEPLAESYPYSLAEPTDDNFGIALFSKLPLEDAHVIRLGTRPVPSIRARVVVGEQRVTLFSTHPPPPLGGRRAGLRNGQLEALAEAARDAEPPVVVLGDLNVTPWSPHFTRLLATSGLIDSSLGWGVQPTWPTMAYPVLIPIDHCLHSKDVGVTQRSTGPDVGSDHYPLFVELVISP